MKNYHRLSLYGIVVLLLYMLSIINLPKDLMLLLILVVYPIVTFIFGAIDGVVFERNLFVPTITGIIFVPIAMIFYNESALIYSLIYFSCNLLGGSLTRYVIRVRQSRKLS